jgi:SAM-dependent methyltransferase
MDVHDRLRAFWDADADTYDRSPSHAATDPVEAAAWRTALARYLPPAPSRILDVGAGTGAIGLLAAELGHEVTALDLSPGMLAQAERKAAARGLPLRTRVGPATDPPDGPFDAVVERHVLWTTPDPVAALASWRRAAPGGRLLLLEGVFARDGLGWRARGVAADAVRRILRIRHDHHASYDPDLLASLPLAHASSPVPLLEAAEHGGWRGVRIQRLRDVEWARRIATPWPLGWLEAAPQFAVIAEG